MDARPSENETPQFAESSLFHNFHGRARALWVGLWNAASLAKYRDERPSDDDEDSCRHESRSDHLGAPEEEHREGHAPERLGGYERGDDSHARAVIRSKEADVGEAEEQSGGRKGDPRQPVQALPEIPSSSRHEEEQRSERSRGDRDSRTANRAARRLAGIPPDEVVAAREEEGGDEG